MDLLWLTRTAWQWTMCVRVSHKHVYSVRFTIPDIQNRMEIKCQRLSLKNVELLKTGFSSLLNPRYVQHFELF